MLPLGCWITRQLLTARLPSCLASCGFAWPWKLVFDVRFFEGEWLAVLIYELGCVCLLC